MSKQRVYRIPRPTTRAIRQDEFTGQLNVWLIRWCYKALRKGLNLNEIDLRLYCEDKVSEYVVSDYDSFMGSGSLKSKTPGQITETQAEQIIDTVVGYVLDNYDPAEFAKIQARRAAKRRRFHASAIRSMMDHSIAETAAALGCSPSTVSRLRRQIRSTPLGALALQMGKALRSARGAVSRVFPSVQGSSLAPVTLRSGRSNDVLARLGVSLISTA